MRKAWWLAIGGCLLLFLLLGMCGAVALVFGSPRGGALFGRSPGTTAGVYLVLAADVSRVPVSEHGTTLEAARTVIQRRAEGYGVSQAVVKREGDDRLSVWLPGVEDVAAVTNLVSKPGLLVFKERAAGSPDAWMPALGTIRGEEKALTGRYVRRASVGYDERGYPELLLEFDPDGKVLLTQVTSRNVGKPLAIFVDEQLVVSPLVQAPITDGALRLTGSFTVAEVRLLALQLNTGALPAPLTIVQTGASSN